MKKNVPKLLLCALALALVLALAACSNRSGLADSGSSAPAPASQSESASEPDAAPEDEKLALGDEKTPLDLDEEKVKLEELCSDPNRRDLFSSKLRQNQLLRLMKHWLKN